MIVEPLRRSRAYLAGEGLGPFLIRSVAWTGVVRFSAMFASFVVGVQLARGLGVKGYGFYGLALSVVTIAGIPGELGLSRLVTREVAAARSRNDLPRLFGVLRWATRTAVLLSLAMAVLAIGGAYLFVNGSAPALALAILVGAPTIPFMALARIDGGGLQGLQHIVRGQIPANLLRPLFLSVLLLVLVHLLRMPFGAPGAMALNSLTAAAVFLIAHVWLSRRLPPEAPAQIIQEGRRWIGSAIPLALTDGMRTLQSDLSVLLLGLLASAAKVGLFRIATITSMTAAAMVLVIGHVAMPVIARLHAENDRERLQKVVTHSARGQFAGVLALSLPLVLAAGPLLGLVFGRAYAQAAGATMIMAFGQIVSAAFGPNVGLLNMTHHERRVTRAMAIAAAINLPGVLVLGSLWGVDGAAIAFVAGLVCWNILLWLDARRFLGVETSILGPSSALRA